MPGTSNMTTVGYRCYNPACGAQIPPPDAEARYCPHCGAAQLFECEACPSRPGALLRVADQCECPRCAAMYVLCRSCHRPLVITATGPLTCPEGCAAGVTEARTGTYAPYANARRTRSVTCYPAGPAPVELTVWQLGEATSGPVCRFGRVFVVTARGTIRALHEDTGTDVAIWEQCSLLPADVTALASVALHVSERFVYFANAGIITACSVVDGGPCFRVPAPAPHALPLISDQRMIVCASPQPEVLCVQLYDTAALCANEPGLVRDWQLPLSVPDHRQPLGPPAVLDDLFVLVDLNGNLLAFPMSGQEDFRVLWENGGYSYVSPPAVYGQVVYLLVHDVKRGAAVVTVGLTGAKPTLVRLGGVTPAYLGLGVTSRNLYFFDGTRDFYELELCALRAQPRLVFHGVEMTGDMEMAAFLALDTSNPLGAWLVTLSGPPGRLTPRMVHTQTGMRPTLGGANGPLALAASDRRILIANMATGEVFVHGIP